MVVITYDSIDMSKIVVGEPEKMKSGSGFMLPIQYNGGPLEIQGSPCRLPWSCGQVQEGYGGTGAPQAKLALQLDPELSGNVFQHVVEQVELMAQQKILSCPELCGSGRKKVTADQLAFQFTSAVKQSDPKYHPFLSVKMPFQADDSNAVNAKGGGYGGGGLGTVTTAVFTKSKKTLPAAQTLLKGAIVVPIVTVSYVWCISGRFGITFRSNRVLLHTPASTDSAFDFDISSDLENQLCSDDVVDSNPPPHSAEGDSTIATGFVGGGSGGKSAEFVSYDDVGGIPVQ